jgi:hypothetical protein
LRSAGIHGASEIIKTSGSGKISKSSQNAQMIASASRLDFHLHRSTITIQRRTTMLTKIMTAALIGATALSAMATESFARPGHRFAIYDGQSGKKVYDDGRLDGRACAVGKKAIYNPNTGRFITVPAAKCNF